MKKIFLIPLMTLLTCVMAWGENVAKNVTTGTEYDNLKTAIEAASAGDEIQMLADLDIAPADFIKITKSLTLDMNRHYIALTATTQAAVQVNGSGIDVTIKNGTIRNAGATYGSNKATNGIYVFVCDSCTLENVTITDAAQGVYGCRNNTILKNCTIDASTYGISTISSYNSTTVVDGGHIKGGTYGIYNQRAASEIKIQSGLIEGSDAAIVLYNGGTLTATGGTIQGTRYYGIWAYSRYASTVNISGNAQVFGPTNALKSQHANSNITIDGGTLNSNSTTIMLNKGNLTISDNALIASAGNYGVYSDATNTTGNITINGGSIGTAENRIGYGIGMKAGTLTMNGGSVYAYARGIASQGGTLIVNDGVNIDIAPTAEHLVNGAAIALAAPASTPINATVNGGTFNATGMAFTQTAGTATINGGSFNGDVRAVELIAGSANATLTIENGSFASKHNTVAATSLAEEYTATLDIKGGSFVVTPDNISTPSTDAVTIIGNTTDNSGERAAYPAIVNISGGTFSGGYAGVSLWGKGAVANISGGSIDANAFGICGNGTSQYNGTEIYITGGNITGDGAGIYHPQAGTLNIKGNPVITGHTAIQLCAGVGLTGSITGGRFEAYGEDNRATKTGDGLIPDGAALSIVNRSYPGGMPQFTIKGGVFLAQHQDAILAYTWSDNTASEWAGAVNYLSAREGIFSSDPTTYVPAEDYTVTKLDPTPTVYNHDEVVYADLWRIGEVNYVQSYDFTEEPAEYVEINATTAAVSPNIEGTVYTLSEDQSSKKVEVAKDYTLIIKEDKTLNIGNGGLDLNAGSQVVVEPGAVVTVGVNGITSASGTDNLVLQANSEKQAALLIDPDVIQNTQPLATVILSTKARQKSANPWNYIWEYFASPVVEITSSNKPTNNFDSDVHGLFAGETEFVTGVYTWGGNDWALVNSWTSLVPFKGYQLTNNSANGGVEYTFKGNLLGNKDGEYAFTSNGYGYFGNSYSAPIVISNFLSALDNTVYERTVWLYDAGADTYVSVNPLAARLGSAKYKDGTAIKEIRSLQAFILNKKADGGNAPINYRDAIWNNPRINSLVSAASAPARERDNDMQWMNIYVAANGNKEMVTLVEGADFSNEFDNGADAGKYINNNSMNLYAATNDGDLAIVATDNLENTLLSFQAGNATEYTLTFENSNENYMLRDNVTGLTIAMIEGAEYSFTQAANSTAQARFEVIGVAKMPTSIENVEETAKKEGIYTLSGQYVGRDFTKLPAGVYVVNGVKIVK